MTKRSIDKKWSTEIHEDWYFDVEGMRTLILGTFPPHPEKWDYSFYYPNSQNLFWSILAKVAGTSLREFKGESAVNERKLLMTKMKVGVQNLGKTAHRKGKSAADRDIKIAEFQDILAIFANCKTLRTVHLTGYSPPTSTYHCFRQYLKAEGIDYGDPEEERAGHRFLVYTERPITCFLGNSTSPQVRRRGITEDMLIEQFRRSIKEE